MAKKTHRENFRVSVYPKAAGDYGFMKFAREKRSEVDELALCEQIVNEIKRHVDEVGQVYAESDTVATCSFCDAKWTEDGDTYNGGCCDEDEANNPAVTPEAA